MKQDETKTSKSLENFSLENVNLLEEKINFRTLKAFKSFEDYSFLTNILEENEIRYRIENVQSAIDITFTGGKGFEDNVVIAVKSSDFEKANKLLEKNASEFAENVDESHYMFDFSNDELFEVVEKSDEWCNTDYMLAIKLLKDKGIEVTEEKREALKNSRLEELRKPKKANYFAIIFGFLSVFIGGFFGIIIGYLLYSLKKKLFNGEKVYVYDEKTRNVGFIMFILGVGFLTFYFITLLMRTNIL